MIKKILAGVLLAGVSYGWVTQSDIAANNLLQYSPAAKPGDVLSITRPGVAGPVAGMTYTTNGWVFESIIVTSNATFPSPMLVTDVVAETVTASTSLTVNGSVVSNITQTVTDSTNSIPSGAAVTASLATKADTNQNVNLFSSGSATDGFVATADGAGGVAWEAAPTAGVDCKKVIPITLPSWDVNVVNNDGYQVTTYNRKYITSGTATNSYAYCRTGNTSDSVFGSITQGRYFITNSTLTASVSFGLKNFTTNHTLFIRFGDLYNYTSYSTTFGDNSFGIRTSGDSFVLVGKATGAEIVSDPIYTGVTALGTAEKTISAVFTTKADGSVDCSLYDKSGWSQLGVTRSVATAGIFNSWLSIGAFNTTNSTSAAILRFYGGFIIYD